MKRWPITLCLVVLAASAVCAQQKDNASPAPKAANDGPSLEVTMKFIQDKLNEIGPVNFTESAHYNDGSRPDTTPVKIKSEKSNVVADPGRCHITYHWKMEAEDVVVHDQDHDFSLKAVADIQVLPMEFAEKELDDPPASNYRVVPPLFGVLVHRKGNTFDFFDLYDQTLANRLGKAMRHAVELCTTSNEPEPF